MLLRGVKARQFAGSKSLRTGLALALGLAGGLYGSSARAQCTGPDCVNAFLFRDPRDQAQLDVQLFEPSPSPAAVFGVDHAQIPSHLTLTASLWTSYARNPLGGVVAASTAGARPASMVGALVQTEAHLSLGLFERLEIGLAMPVTYVSHAALNDFVSRPGSTDARDFENAASNPCNPANADDAAHRGMPDPSQRREEGAPAPTYSDHANGFDFTAQDRVCSTAGPGDLRLFLKVPILRGPWSLSARLGATVPTATRGHFLGNVSWTFTPSLVLTRRFGLVTASANLGFRLRQRNGIQGADEGGENSSLVLDDEVLWGFGARFDVHRMVALNAEISGRIGASGGVYYSNRVPVELDAGAVISPSERVGIVVGVGRGLGNGYGVPDVRAFAALRVAATRTLCATGPEDYDGFEDGDFCADPDNDRDRIPDAADRCPNDAEDADGVLDDDGCPEADNDADGVLDDNDRCPIEPEDQDGFQDNDGCPEGDNDRDGIADVQDECPREPEDLDNFQDSDGCPEPGPEAVAVTRTDSHLLLSQRVFFDYDSDTIRPVSFPILNELGLALRRNPDILRVRVEGYSDGQGDPQYNLDLSFRRARAVVEYLVAQGVTRDRLDFRGYGPQRPVADDSTPEGQALNRRVEFTITDQAGATSAANPTGNTNPAPGSAPAQGGGRRGGGRRRGAPNTR